MKRHAHLTTHHASWKTPPPFGGMVASSRCSIQAVSRALHALAGNKG